MRKTSTTCCLVSCTATTGLSLLCRIAVFILASCPVKAARVGPIGFSFAVGVFLDAFVVRLTLVPATMAIIGSRLWYHPQRFARYVPDPDIEGQRLEHELTEAELAPAGASAREG